MNEIKRSLELVVWINFFPEWLDTNVTTSMFFFISKVLQCGDQKKFRKNVFWGVQIRKKNCLNYFILFYFIKNWGLCVDSQRRERH
jgi:hypothetical protein